MCGDERTARRVLEDAIKLSGEDGVGWWVLNSVSVNISEGNTDLDVLVGIPNQGILIIEVKGWTDFSVSEYNRWTYRGRGGNSVDAGDGPYKQAEREEYLFLHLLSGLRSRKRISSGDLPKVGSCVLFGNVKSENFTHAGVHENRTLYKNTFCPNRKGNNADAKDLLNKLRNILREQANPDRSTNNGVERIAEIRDFLSPLCSVRGLSAFIDETQIQIDRISESSLGERASVYSGNRLYVEGPAGTGKTCYALKLAAERVRLTGRTALFVCFSERLASEVRSTEWISELDLIVGTPEDLIVRFGDQFELKDFLLAESDALDAGRKISELTGIDMPKSLPRSYLGGDQFIGRLIDVLADSGVEFSAVVVDEAQDFLEPLLNALCLVVASTDLFAVFADPRQTTRRERFGIPWGKPSCLEDSDVHLLERNYRNGDRIIDAVEKEFSIGYGRPPAGSSPAEVSIIEYAASKALPEIVQKQISELVEDGIDPTLLVSGVNHAEIEKMKSFGLDPILVDEFKGLERSCIIFAQGYELNPLDPNREDLYVGLTRATTFLTVVRPVNTVKSTSSV